MRRRQFLGALGTMAILGRPCTVPESPGFGLAIDERKFGGVAENFDLKA